MSIFRNGIIEADEATCKQARDMILDGALPVTKIVGFSVGSNSKTTGVIDITSRSNLLLENTIELTNNLARVFFAPNENRPNYRPRIIKTRNENKIMWGSNYDPVYSKRETFYTEGDSLEVIDEDIYLFTPQGDVSLTLILHRGTGIINFEEALDITNKTIGNQNKGTALGIPVSYHLKDYIRILPPINGVYKYRLHGGMTDDIINRLWNDKDNN